MAAFPAPGSKVPGEVLYFITEFLFRADSSFYEDISGKVNKEGLLELTFSFWRLRQVPGTGFAEHELVKGTALIDIPEETLLYILREDEEEYLALTADKLFREGTPIKDYRHDKEDLSSVEEENLEAILAY